MQISNLSVLLTSITCLIILFTTPQTVFAVVPVQLRINVSRVPDNQVEKQVEILKKLQMLFTKKQVSAGFWFSGSAYRQIKSYNSQLVIQLLQNNFLIAHHGANRGRQGNRPIDKIAGMDWDTAVAWAIDYEQRMEGGGLNQLQNDFNGKVHVTGRFFKAPVLQATKELGCQAMIGLKGQLKAPSNAAWYMGMFNLPDRVTILPDAIQRSTLNPGSLYANIDQITDKWPDQSVETISILVHSKDFLRGSPSEQQKFWLSYSDLISWISIHPDLETVTYNDLIERVIDDRRPLLENSTLFKAVQHIRKLDKLPLYILVDDLPLSMADLFYSLASSLTTYSRSGWLPEKVQVENLLGPVIAKNGKQPIFVTSKAILSSIVSWFRPTIDRIPSSLLVNKTQANSSALLFAMAEIFNDLYQGKRSPHQVRLKSISIFPAQTEDCPDELSRLQFWTYKPQRTAIKVEQAKAVIKIVPSTPISRVDTPIYVTVYSHNEENAPWTHLVTKSELYQQYRSNLIKKVKLIHNYGAVLSWQTDYAVLEAMLKYEKGNLLKNTNNKNILQWMVEDMGVEIAPHGHLTRYNYADIFYLIKKLEITPAAVIGGFALYTCNKTNQSITNRAVTERAWRKDLEIDPNGTITGRTFPAFTWKPRIIVQPAMIGHVFGDYSSGIWQIDTTGNFTDHHQNGKFMVIGQGYPHYVENIGNRHASSAMNVSSSLWYIKELAERIQTTKEMQGRIYTASIHTIDYPKSYGIDTYEGLKKTLEEIAPLVRTHRVVFMNYEDIATLWKQKYHEVPNRYPIDNFLFFNTLQQDLQKYCQVIPANGRPHNMNSNKCGDNICDAYEQLTGLCERDCPSTLKLKAGKQANKTNHNSCGDGICDSFEQQTDLCKIDCSSQATSGRKNRAGLTNSHLCGDDVCDEHEKRSGMCPQDCK